MGKFKNLKGMKFNNLEVIEYMGQNRHNKAQWLCRCDCGREKVVLGASLLNDHTKSCGCLQKKAAKQTGESCRKYSSRPTGLYTAWHNMMSRCTNPNNVHYRYYGQRGINVCEEWLDFEMFMKWAKESGYSEEYTLDRIDNEKGYCPENCRWADRLTQGQNRRNVITVLYRGETAPLSKFAREFGIKPSVARDRYYAGWSIDRILKTPVKK